MRRAGQLHYHHGLGRGHGDHGLGRGHGDHLGSTTLTTDSANTIIAEARYLPFGGERWAGGAAAPTDYGFTGQRFEAGFGLSDYNARYYSARLGQSAILD